MSIKNVDDRPRFNIADVIIIIISLLVIAGIGLRAYGIFAEEDDMQSVTIEFAINNISEGSSDLKKGDNLFLVSDNSKVGYILDVKTEAATTYAYDENGELVKATVPGKVTVKGKMVLDGKMTEKGFYLSGKTLLTETKEISLYTAEREAVFTIVKIAD